MTWTVKATNKSKDTNGNTVVRFRGTDGSTIRTFDYPSSNWTLAKLQDVAGRLAAKWANGNVDPTPGSPQDNLIQGCIDNATQLGEAG